MRRADDQFNYAAGARRQLRGRRCWRSWSTTTSRRWCWSTASSSPRATTCRTCTSSWRATSRCERRHDRARRARHRAGQRAIKDYRPEIDLYLLSDRAAGKPRRQRRGRAGPAHVPPRRGADGDPPVRSSTASRTATRRRTSTTCKKYAQRPIGTFHALPIARGKSVFRSNWIRDMGQFYGTNIFFAESSRDHRRPRQPARADRQHQEGAGSRRARLRRATRVYLGTNGTSTSNKIVVQAVCKPGDIVIVDRNCHKSHHYGFVLARRAAVLRRGVSADAVLDVRRGAAAHDQEGAARLQGRGQARPRQGHRPDQLHLRRAHVQPAPGDGRVPGDQAGPDLPVGRGVVRLRALQPVPPPPHRHGRGRGADRRGSASPAYRAEYEACAEEGRQDRPEEPEARSTRTCCPIRTRCASASTRPTRPTSRCRRSGRAR